MQIVVRPLMNEDGIKEWFIIEMQGDLENKTGDESLTGKFIGDLHFNKDGMPIFIIRHHILFGKIQTLNKPLGVLQKINKSNPEDDEDCPEGNKNQRDSGTDVEYVVKAIVSKKIVFRDRPKPIVGCNSILKKKLEMS